MARGAGPPAVRPRIARPCLAQRAQHSTRAPPPPTAAQVEAAWGARRAFPARLPLASNFSCGFGRRLHSRGAVVDGAPYLDLCSTSLLPSGGAAAPAPAVGEGAAADGALRLQLTTEDAYEGGSCVAVALEGAAAAPAAAQGGGRPQPLRAVALLWALDLPLPPQGGLAVEAVVKQQQPPPLQQGAQQGGGGRRAPAPALALVLYLDGGARALALPLGPAGAAAAAALGAGGAPAEAVGAGEGSPSAAGGGWQRWAWRVPARQLRGARGISGVDVAVSAAAAGGAPRTPATPPGFEPAAPLALLGRLALEAADM